MSDHRHRYTNRGGIHATYKGTCPYCGYSIEPMSGDMIKKGPKGWGHVACVNLKTHWNNEGGHPLCGTIWTTNTKITRDWSEVTCKKCIKRKGTEKIFQEEA